MAELMEAQPPPHLPNQPRTTEDTTPTSNSPTGETASRVSAPDGGARGLTGNVSAQPRTELTVELLVRT